MAKKEIKLTNSEAVESDTDAVISTAETKVGAGEGITAVLYTIGKLCEGDNSMRNLSAARALITQSLRQMGGVDLVEQLNWCQVALQSLTIYAKEEELAIRGR